MKTAIKTQNDRNSIVKVVLINVITKVYYLRLKFDNTVTAHIHIHIIITITTYYPKV